MAKTRLPPPAKNRKPPLSIAELGAKAEALEARNDRDGAAQLYRDWIKQSKSPLVWVAHFNLGVLLKNMGDMEGAIESYRASLAGNPKLPHARINLGTALEVLNKPDEAIEEWKTALKYLDEDPKTDLDMVCTVLNNLGRRLEVMQKYTEAEEMLTRSLLLKPNQEAVLYHRIFLRQKQCAWPIYAPLPGITLEDQQAATSAVAMLSISDDPELQLRTALSQVPGKIPKDLPKLAPADGYAHDRLRIGYLSSNFGMHAVSILTAELYELHDRSRVEVWGFCWSPEDNTEMRERVIKAMDHFVRIKDISDEEAAKAIRAAEIDVLIDLQGLTAGCRPKILAYRPAPVQVTYLGFPGTTALPEIDYVLADRYIIPEEMAEYFTEKPLYLPDCFQVNDRKRISSEPKTRSEYGLPESAFVFCAFNNNIKFTPEFFAAWMRILGRTPNSVLWLLADNERARSNLLRCAEEHGISSERLVFATRVPVADYLARFRVANLFLDLSPFNGGTTAADALWMGLPIITCSGKSFASRMAGSLLQAIGLPELITTTLDDYENLAVALAENPELVKELNGRVKANKETYPLFDAPKTVRELENLLVSVAKKPFGNDQQDHRKATSVPASIEARMDYLPAETSDILKTAALTRFHLGCGTVFLKGWLNIGHWLHLEQGKLYRNPNQTEDTILLNHDLRLGIPTADNSLEAVYHSHMLEHLSYKDGLVFLEKIFRALKPGGIHRIVVPDLEAFAKAYVGGDSLLLDKYKEHVLSNDADIYQTKASIFMGMLHNHGHLCGYDWDTLRWALERIGFKKVRRTLFQESDLPDIKTIEEYGPLRAMESVCVECYK
ncbi:MAG: tetratricopeptide repeat protein [Sulfuritalea sp.]|jgi:predicted O-linked N-acetylglucosamine transferase (SPINDLY family)|nr:tetratricopeptide repeat protein [Sulfuritalea sp.]